MPDFFTVTVSQVTRRLSMIVKGDKALNDLYVSGEISNFTLHKASGHMYFTLKDETASIKCVMFAGNARSLDFTGAYSRYAQKYQPKSEEKACRSEKQHRIFRQVGYENTALSYYAYKCGRQCYHAVCGKCKRKYHKDKYAGKYRRR